jgi:hypothetical protein
MNDLANDNRELIQGRIRAPMPCIPVDSDRINRTGQLKDLTCNIKLSALPESSTAMTIIH